MSHSSAKRGNIHSFSLQSFHPLSSAAGDDDASIGTLSLDSCRENSRRGASPHGSPHSAIHLELGETGGSGGRHELEGARPCQAVLSFLLNAYYHLTLLTDPRSRS